MALKTPSPQILRFGIYEVDLRSGELRKQGKRIKLQDQPFQVLTVLLQRPSDVVTREELRSQIWPKDTFVDFDNGLNTAINKLREALGDSAENPRFVETLPRRGYRFIASVSPALRDNPSAPSKTPNKVVAVAAVAAAVAATALVGWLWRSNRVRSLTDKDSIVLADFVNSTGEPVFDETLKQGLRVQLEQSPFLNIVSDQQVSEQLRLMGHAVDDRLTRDLARDVCQRLGSEALLSGSISSMGTQYVIGLVGLNCRSGDVLAEEQEQANSREQVLAAVSKCATNLRKKLGESLASIKKYDSPLEQATTRSLEAFQAYSLGLREAHSKGDAASLPFYLRAVQLDPGFVMAYARLGTAYANVGDVTAAVENTTRAYELRQNVSAWERLYVDTHYHSNVTGELEKAAHEYEVWTQIYPAWGGPHDNLAGIYQTLGRHAEALTQALEAVRLGPDTEDNYATACESHLYLDHINEAAAVLRLADTRKLEGEFLLWCRYQVAFLQQNATEMDRIVAGSANKGDPQGLLGIQGLGEAQRGRLLEARELWRRSVAYARNSHALDRAALYQVTAGMIEAYFGNSKGARLDIEAGQALGMNHDSELTAAFALALAGNVKEAEQLIEDLNKKWPLDSVVQRYWLPTIRAAIALDLAAPNRAIELLGAMGSYEMSAAGQLDPVYVRGRAYLTEGKGPDAVAQFEKILGHPGLVLENPVRALARLGLARAYSLQHDVSKSRAAYQDFFALWKDADPDIPVLKEAKAEYAKLR